MEGEMGQIRNGGVFLPFLSLFLFRQYLPAIILKCLPSFIKCVLLGKPACSKTCLHHSIF